MLNSVNEEKLTSKEKDRKRFTLTPGEYERLVQKIVDGCSNQPNLEKHKCGARNKILGNSGYKHQIDVSFRYKDTGKFLLIECKQCGRRITVEDLILFQGRITDIGLKEGQIPAGIMCSAQGYTKGAEKYAKAYGIILNEVKDSADFSIVYPKVGNVVQLSIGERQNVR